jgi:hypothetical protein
MSKQEAVTVPSGHAVVASRKPGLTQELKAEWVQQTLKVERLASSQIKGAEDQPIGNAETEERMSIVLPAGSSIEAAREALVEFVNGLG